MSEVAQLLADLDFLVERVKAAGSCSFGNDRWTGMSSNALVEVAFGGSNECLPGDANDLAACYRTVLRLPAHRRTSAVLAQLRRGEAGIRQRHPADLEWARNVSGWMPAAHVAESGQ